jgi:triacylglycerol esterase/lipase EstA (alpha/beta hydrolase family)
MGMWGITWDEKAVLFIHSMGTMAARLYIYSNELAAEGKYFKEGFYKDDVQKVVFLSPPMEGTELAVAA